MNRPSRQVLALVALVAVAACGAEATSDNPADGGMRLYAEGRNGAAGQAVDCDTAVTGGFNPPGEFDNGAVADSPSDARELAFKESGVDGVATGYRVVQEENTRVLYTFDVDGETKQAIIVHDGEAVGGTGWYVESWARCDLAELPASAAKQAGVQIWKDADGERVPTTKVQSYGGSEHCDWQDMTYLEIGRRFYVANVEPGLRDFFDRPYEEDATLPGDAVDTGYHLGDDHLWLSHDKRLAYVGDRQSVDIWPSPVKRFGCA